jgi:hypothetical protein
VLHKWREVSMATAETDLRALDTLSPHDFIGVE